MYIPCKVEGLPYNFTFQFDLGAGLTEIYENNISSFFKLHPGPNKNIKRLQSPLQFWNSKKMFQDLTIKFGNFSASTKKATCIKVMVRKYQCQTRLTTGNFILVQ